MRKLKVCVAGIQEMPTGNDYYLLVGIPRLYEFQFSLLYFTNQFARIKNEVY